MSLKAFLYWVFLYLFVYPGFLLVLWLCHPLETKNIHNKIRSDSKQNVGMNVSMHGSLSLCKRSDGLAF